MNISPANLLDAACYYHTKEGASMFLLHSLVYWRDSKRRAASDLDKFYASGQIAAADTAFRVLTGIRPDDALLLSLDDYRAQIGGAK